MKLIIDFDDTIFDTEHFKKEKLFPCLVEYGISSDEFEKNYEHYRISHPIYDIEEHMQSIKDNRSLDFDTESIMYQISKGLEEFVFPEYLSVLRKYGRENVFILTQGDDNFQRIKIQRSEIEEKVQEIMVVEGSKEQKIKELLLLWPNESVIYLDDKFKNLKFDMENGNLTRVFVGNKENLTEEEREYMKKNSIEVCERKDIEKKIPLYRENLGVETSPELHFNKERII